MLRQSALNQRCRIGQTRVLLAEISSYGGALVRPGHRLPPPQMGYVPGYALRNINAPRRHSSNGIEGVVPDKLLLLGSIAGVAAQIVKVAESIELVQGQIAEVGARVEATKVALGQSNVPAENREILLMELKSLMYEKKGLMDKEKGLMDEKKGLMDEKNSLMDKEAKLMDATTSTSRSSDEGRRWSDWFQKHDWRKYVTGGLVVFGALATFNKDTDRSIEAFFKSLSMSNSFVKSRPSFESVAVKPSDYITRPSLETKVLAVYENSHLKDGWYHIVYGVKGAGKTSIVQSVLGDKTGVVVVSVSNEDKTDTIVAKIQRACGMVPHSSSTVKKIGDAMQVAAEKRNGHPVTVVFEVERGSSSPEVLSLVKHTAKVFALVANVLIVLSDANTVLQFGDDKRQKFILVGELTREEARAYVQKRAPNISSEDFNKFADKCGTYPLMLGIFCASVCKGETADEHIAKVVDSARGDLEAFVHKPILAALKKSPGGVRSGNFDGVKHEGVLLSAPKDVAPAMKKVNAIMYDFEARQYKLFSKAHETALKTFDPPRS